MMSRKQQELMLIAERMIKEELGIDTLYEVSFRLVEGIGGWDYFYKFEDDQQVAYMAECTPQLRYLQIYKEMGEI